MSGTRHGAWTRPTLVLDELRPRLLERVRGRTASFRSDSLIRYLRRHCVCVILGEYLDLSLPLVDVADRLEVPLFVHAHGYDVSKRLRDDRWVEAYARYNDIGGVITMSDASKRRLVGIGLEGCTIHVVPYGVDVPDEPHQRAHRINAVRCLAVGRFVPKKAPLATLEAFHCASTETPGMRLDYVGGGPLMAAAREYVHSAGIADRVTFHGFQPADRVAALLTQADIFVQHSVTDPETGDEEGLPLAILEAMASALAIVATRHAGIPEAVMDGETGYLVGEWDVAGMADAIRNLARDPGLRQFLGEAAWRVARSRFTWERERAKLRRILSLEP